MTSSDIDKAPKFINPARSIVINVAVISVWFDYEILSLNIIEFFYRLSAGLGFLGERKWSNRWVERWDFNLKKVGKRWALIKIIYLIKLYNYMYFYKSSTFANKKELDFTIIIISMFSNVKLSLFGTSVALYSEKDLSTSTETSGANCILVLNSKSLP